MKKLLIALVITVLATSTVFAVPRIQLYIPDASYDYSTQSWVTTSNEFDIWVIASNLDKGQLHNLTLVAAIGSANTPMNGALSITDENSLTTTFNTGDYYHGTPPPGSGLLPPHDGVYPGWYTQMQVAAVTGAPYQTVVDYTPDGDGGTNDFGNVFKYHVTTSYSYLNFDAYGYYQDVDGKFKFAPFSHNAEFQPIPEPATLVLLGLGLVGAGVYRRFRK